ncbi:MAG: four helix bundle protein [Saprospiraceae bacterium]|nr:four helix bundle protein [Saprospiraceae bacterium]
MEEERTYNFFRFEDLRLYDKSLKYIEWVFQTTKLFPEIEVNGLATKFLNSAQNIALNIAEGSGRNKSQFIYHLKLAKTSIRECIVFTTIAKRLDYISEETEEQSRYCLIEISKMLGALISSLQRSSREGNGSSSNYHPSQKAVAETVDYNNDDDDNEY